ncbi:hypothetical protein JTE90_025435 [Oedothorax gibbosus]|uniref:MARVEL domain-containing protein n=1 Tax=Oedothorax gibbosus TaxID=931172 RepID=A0AAV6U8T9_9ARAC|nr:hypothetical protein JTE90_025435 [Oedothorax gibbosus]
MKCWNMGNKTQPAPELLLAQLILSVILVVLVSHATYEDDYVVPTFTFQMHHGKPIFRTEGKKSIPINEFRASYTVLLLLAVSSAYFFVNLLLYVAIKMLHEGVLYGTIMIVIQDVTFCVLMLVCSLGTVAYRGERAVHSRDTELLIASGISMFCCVSSGIGVYYSYKVYKGI